MPISFDNRCVGRRRRAQIVGATLAFLLVAATGVCSTLTGRVADEQRNPLPYAPIAVSDSGDTQIVAVAHADSTGAFAFDRLDAGAYLIRVQYVGHDPFEQLITIDHSPKPLTIVLRSRSIRADDVVVTASRRPEATSATSASVAIVSGEEIRTRGVRSFDQALETAQGLQVYRSHGIATNTVSIRGSSDVLGGGVGNRVLLLLDGRPALIPASGGQTWSLLPLGMVDRIEVVKGAFSALYGSSAMGGVINLITRTPTAHPVSTMATHFGFYEKPPQWMSYRDGVSTFSGFTATHSASLGNADYLLMLSRDQSDGHRQSTDYDVWQAFGKVRHAFSPSRNVTALVGGGRSHAGYPHRWINTIEPLHIAPEKRNDRQNKYWWSIDLSARAVSDGSGILETGLYSYGNASETIQEPGIEESGHDSYRVGGRTQWQKQITVGFVQTFGADGSFDIVRSDSILYGNRDARNLAAFSLSALKLGPHARIDLGLRYDYSSLSDNQSETQFNPKLGLTVPVGETFTVRASIGRAFRSPSIAERFLVLEPAGGTEFASNDSLRAEKVISYELGISHNFAPILKLDVAGFVNDYNDWIYWRELPADPLTGAYRFQVANLLKVRMSGIDATMRLNPMAQFTLNLNYLYLLARDRTANRTDDLIPYRPRHTFSGQLVFTHGRLKTSIMTRARSAVEETVFAAYRYDAPGAFAVTDARVEFAFRSWITGGVDVRNLFNQQYEEMARYRLPGRSYAFTLALRK